MPFELSIPCTDCEERTASLELKHFEVLGCDPDPARAGRCLLTYSKFGVTEPHPCRELVDPAPPPPPGTAQ